MAAVSRFGDGHEKAHRAQNNSALENIVPVLATDSVFYLELVPGPHLRNFVGIFVGKLCRNRPFSTELRQSVSTKIDDKVGNESFGTSSI